MNKKNYYSPVVEQFATYYLADICQVSQVPVENPESPGSGTPTTGPEQSPAFRRLL